MISRPRPAEETERAHGPPEFRTWVKTQPCIVPGCRWRGCDSAHITNGGIGRKDDWTRTVPLCFARPGWVGHHHEYDNGKESFPIRHRLDMPAEAAKHHARWLVYAATLEGLPW
jgi:hypothetical protein